MATAATARRSLTLPTGCTCRRISADNVCQPGTDRQLGVFSAANFLPLAVGGRYDQSQSVVLPADLAVGDYYLLLGRWDFIEIHDPWNAQETIRSRLDACTAAGV